VLVVYDERRVQLVSEYVLRAIEMILGTLDAVKIRKEGTHVKFQPSGGTILIKNGCDPYTLRGIDMDAKIVYLEPEPNEKPRGQSDYGNAITPEKQRKALELDLENARRALEEFDYKQSTRFFEVTGGTLEVYRKDLDEDFTVRLYLRDPLNPTHPGYQVDFDATYLSAESRLRPLPDKVETMRVRPEPEVHDAT
jgi:hypothetical protein